MSIYNVSLMNVKTGEIRIVSWVEHNINAVRQYFLKAYAKTDWALYNVVEGYPFVAPK